MHGKGNQRFELELVVVYCFPVAGLGCVPYSDRPLGFEVVQPLDETIGIQKEPKAGQVGGAEQNAKIGPAAKLANDLLVWLASLVKEWPNVPDQPRA